jgi:group I intron endonuclease
MERFFACAGELSCGVLVYLVRNSVNGKVYVGKTTKSLKLRWRSHRYAARRGSQLALHVAIREHGESAFRIEELDRAETAEELADLEIHYIVSFRSHLPEVGYNRLIVEFSEWNATNPRFLGLQHSDETKAAIRDLTRDYWASLSPEDREARKSLMRGRRPEESRKRMKEAVHADGRLDRMLAARRAQEAQWRAEKEAYELANPKPPVSDKYRASQAEKTRASWASMTREQRDARKRKMSASPRKRVSPFDRPPVVRREKIVAPKQEQPAKRGGWNKGKKTGIPSPQRGIKVSPEIAAKHLGEKNGMFGRKQSPETRRLISEKAKARNMTGSRNPMFGVPSPMTGLRQTPEAIEKVRAAKLEYWKNWRAARASESVAPGDSLD